jgi:hypothetical protein
MIPKLKHSEIEFLKQETFPVLDSRKPGMFVIEAISDALKDRELMMKNLKTMILIIDNCIVSFLKYSKQNYYYLVNIKTKINAINEFNHRMKLTNIEKFYFLTLRKYFRKMQKLMPIPKITRILKYDCIICDGKESCVIFAPCGHQCICKICFQKFQFSNYINSKCPMCAERRYMHYDVNEVMDKMKQFEILQV